MPTIPGGAQLQRVADTPPAFSTGGDCADVSNATQRAWFALGHFAAADIDDAARISGRRA